MATEPTIWPYGGRPGGYHDAVCRCEQHCRNCFDDLPSVRALRERMAAEGRGADFPPLGPREKYCCTYCRGRAARERALDRRIAQHTPQEKT